MLFLDQPEVQKEYEGIRNMARILSKSDASLDAYEKDDMMESSIEIHDNKQSICENSDGNISQLGEASSNRVHIKEKSDKTRHVSTKVILRKHNQLSQSTKLERNRTRQKSLSKEFQLELPANLVLSILNGLFVWQKNQENQKVLKIDRLIIPKGILNVHF